MKEKYISSFDGKDVYYRITKKKNAKANLVFIHGLSGNWTGWKSVINMLSKENFSLLAFDIRGHGKSDKSAKINLDSCSEDLVLMLNKEKINKVVLISHCFGGLVAMDFYKKFPQMVTRLVLVSTTSATPFSHRKILKFFAPGIGALAKILLSFYVPIRKNFNYNDCSKYKDKSLLYILMKDLSANPLGAYWASLAEFFKKRDQDFLEKISIPVLLISGDKDIYISHNSSEFMHEKIKESELHIIKNADHIPLIRHPEMVSKMILDFL